MEEAKTLDLVEGLDEATAGALAAYLEKPEKDRLGRYLALERQRALEDRDYESFTDRAANREHEMAFENLKHQHALEIKEKELELEQVRHRNMTELKNKELEATWVREKSLEDLRYEHQHALKEKELEGQKKTTMWSTVGTVAVAILQVGATVVSIVCAKSLAEHNDAMLAERDARWMSFAAGEDAMPGDYKSAIRDDFKSPLDFFTKFRR